VVISTWLTALACAAAGAGLAAGSARVAAIDAGALAAPGGARVHLRGTIDSLPRAEDQGVEAELETASGRALLVAPHGSQLEPGEEVEVRGRAAPPEQWRAERLRARGVRTAIAAESVVATGGRRGGPQGIVDAGRERAERALGRGMPEREAALARGFVLGQDDRIDEATRQDFRRSGLAHLLRYALAARTEPPREALGPPPTPRPACPHRLGQARPAAQVEAQARHRASASGGLLPRPVLRDALRRPR